MKNERVRNKAASNLSKLFTTIFSFLACVYLVKMEMSLLHKILVAGGLVVVFRFGFFVAFKLMLRHNVTFMGEEIGEFEKDIAVPEVPVQGKKTTTNLGSVQYLAICEGVEQQ